MNLKMISFSNEKLRDLLIEVRKINKSEKPANVKMSSDMSKLFSIEKRETSYFNEALVNVKRSIENEILERFEDGDIGLSYH